MAIERYGTVCVEVPDFSAADVKRLRKEVLGLTQFEFAVKYGIPIYTVQAWEAGKRRPNVLGRMALQEIANSQEGSDAAAG